MTLAGQFAILVLAVALGAAVWAGCGDDKNPVTPGGGGPTTTTFTGFFANGAENGSINVTINSTSLSPRPAARFRTRPAASPFRAPLRPAHDVTATGVLKFVGGGSISLTGTYNDEADSLNLSNTLSGYAFASTYDTTGTLPEMLGQYTGPNGGGFFACATGGTEASSYCGRFDSDSTTTTGNWNILVTGSKVAGTAFPTAGAPFGFEGTIETTGTLRSIMAWAVPADPVVFGLNITGTLDTTTNMVSGSWTFYDYIMPPLHPDSGTWSGSLCPQ